MAEKKSRGWLTIVYPESAPVDWWDKLAQLGCVAICSPLHDLDLLPEPEEDGREHKKPHYHVGLIWDGPTTFKNASELVSQISGVGCIPMQSVRGSCRYFCHLDSPDKARYDPSQVRVLGGLDYDEIIHSSGDDELTLYEIFDWLDATGCVSFRALMVYARKERTDWAKVITRRYRENVIAYQRSILWEYEHQGLISVNPPEVST